MAKRRRGRTSREGDDRREDRLADNETVAGDTGVTTWVIFPGLHVFCDVKFPSISLRGSPQRNCQREGRRFKSGRPLHML